MVVPPTPLEAICSHETWDEIYIQLVEHITTHRSTLVFVNSRRLAEGWLNGAAPGESSLAGKVVVVNVWAYW